MEKNVSLKILAVLPRRISDTSEIGIYGSLAWKSESFLILLRCKQEGSSVNYAYLIDNQ